MYQRIWDAAIGEVLDCDREPDNAVDHYAVKVVKDAAASLTILTSSLAQQMEAALNVFDRLPSGSGSSLAL